eukprot:1981084-Alexandrium_andersonii.AAC.1
MNQGCARMKELRRRIKTVMAPNKNNALARGGTDTRRPEDSSGACDLASTRQLKSSWLHCQACGHARAQFRVSGRTKAGEGEREKAERNIDERDSRQQTQTK